MALVFRPSVAWMLTLSPHGWVLGESEKKWHDSLKELSEWHIQIEQVPSGSTRA